MNSTQVLIVGAGPTGLSMAMTLKRLGIQFRLIDKNLARSDKSKALGVQAGTLEALEQMFGRTLPEKMIEAGYCAQKALFHFGNATPVRVDVSTIPSKYNFILMLAQDETERIFEEELDGCVERKTELIALEQVDEKMVAQVREANGAISEITSDFVVGCDGAHSSVRHLLDISFAGGSYTGDFILGDVKVEWPYEHGIVTTFVSDKGAIAIFPMKGDRRYRFVILSGHEPNSDVMAIDLEEFQKIVNHLIPSPVKVSHPIWLTRFRLHHRMAQRFQKGRAFLAGDAAHIHSPAGAQGMNTGIQDALSLGFKLARVLKEKEPIESLRQYEKTRLPVARRVLKGTDLASKFVLAKDNRVISWFRSTIVPRMFGTSFFQKTMATLISQVGVARREMAERTNYST